MYRRLAADLSYDSKFGLKEDLRVGETTLVFLMANSAGQNVLVVKFRALGYRQNIRRKIEIIIWIVTDELSTKYWLESRDKIKIVFNVWLPGCLLCIKLKLGEFLKADTNNWSVDLVK